jgi:hypothetical protein
MSFTTYTPPRRFQNCLAPLPPPLCDSLRRQNTSSGAFSSQANPPTRAPCTVQVAVQQLAARHQLTHKKPHSTQTVPKPHPVHVFPQHCSQLARARTCAVCGCWWFLHHSPWAGLQQLSAAAGPTGHNHRGNAAPHLLPIGCNCQPNTHAASWRQHLCTASMARVSLPGYILNTPSALELLMQNATHAKLNVCYNHRHRAVRNQGHIQHAAPAHTCPSSRDQPSSSQHPSGHTHTTTSP